MSASIRISSSLTPGGHHVGGSVGERAPVRTPPGCRRSCSRGSSRHLPGTGRSGLHGRNGTDRMPKHKRRGPGPPGTRTDPRTDCRRCRRPHGRGSRQRTPRGCRPSRCGGLRAADGGGIHPDDGIGAVSACSTGLAISSQALASAPADECVQRGSSSNRQPPSSWWRNQGRTSQPGQDPQEEITSNGTFNPRQRCRVDHGEHVD